MYSLKVTQGSALIVSVIEAIHLVPSGKQATSAGAATQQVDAEEDSDDEQ